MRDFVTTCVNGKPLQLRGADVFTSLSDLLRSTLNLTGTKVVCAEGDCGSCTVLLGRPDGGRLDYRAVCSCILYGGQLDGCHVVTVEGLAYDGQLNPVQSAMVQCQGTQCGFCTPGFIATMCGAFESDPDLSPARLRRELTGNLCRCTGYDSILAAGAAVDRRQLRAMNDLYPPASVLPALADAAASPVSLRHGDWAFAKPTTVADAVAFRAEHPDCLIVAGGTDLGVQLNKGHRPFGHVLSLGGIAELTELSVADGTITAGATVTLSRLERLMADHIPAVADMLSYCGGPTIKNAGTVGGNIGTGSPIGDTLPAWFVLGAEVELAGPGGSRRRVNINDFYTGYRKNVVAAGELIVRLHVPLPAAAELFKVYKISKRKDLDISTFSAAIGLRADGNDIAEVRLAYGGVAATVVRLPRTEAALRGKPMTEATFAAAAAVAEAEVKPISDVRGSADYRRRLAGNVLRRFYLEHICEAEEKS
jgi:xanthine dehydrogenase small subunit